MKLVSGGWDKKEEFEAQFRYPDNDVIFELLLANLGFFFMFHTLRKCSLFVDTSRILSIRPPILVSICEANINSSISFV